MITRGLLSIEISCDKAGCETPAETVVVGLAPDVGVLLAADTKGKHG